MKDEEMSQHDGRRRDKQTNTRDPSGEQGGVPHRRTGTCMYILYQIQILELPSEL